MFGLVWFISVQFSLLWFGLDFRLGEEKVGRTKSDMSEVETSDLSGTKP